MSSSKKGSLSMMDDVIPGVYFGDRGLKFKRLIENLLNFCNIKDKYKEVLLSEESMELYGQAFTSDTVNEQVNYQYYEQLGDVSGNKFIVWYFYNRFPQLKCSEGVKVVARLRINYGAKQSFFEMAKNLGFWDFISASNDCRQRKMKSLLEDVFEAFLGVTEEVLDKTFNIGLGYCIVYVILENIFNRMDISLKYEDLYDSKTRLKELFDLHSRELGPLVYLEEKNELVTSTVYRVKGGSYEQRSDGSINMKRIVGGKYIELGKGSASLKADAQQKAAEMALQTLKKQGWVKEIPQIYSLFDKKELPPPKSAESPPKNKEDSKNQGKKSKNKEESDKDKSKKNKDKITKQDILDFIDKNNEEMKKKGEFEEDEDIKEIDRLRRTRTKTKYSVNYKSTILSMYCRNRNYSGARACVDLEADPNILDTNELSSLDLLFIGKVEEDTVRKILKCLMVLGCNGKIRQSIFDKYVSQYTDEYILKKSRKFKIIEEESDSE